MRGFKQRGANRAEYEVVLLRKAKKGEKQIFKKSAKKDIKIMGHINGLLSSFSFKSSGSLALEHS